MDYFTTEGKFSASLRLRSRPPVSNQVEKESRICVRVWKDRGSEKDRNHKVNMHREPVKTACHSITPCIKQAQSSHNQFSKPGWHANSPSYLTMIKFMYSQLLIVMLLIILLMSVTSDSFTDS